jgi:hypothetical protein
MGQKFDFSISSGDYIQCIVKDVKKSAGIDAYRLNV